MNQTPWYQNAGVWATVLGMVIPLVNQKLGVSLDPAKLAYYGVMIVTFVASHHLAGLKAAAIAEAKKLEGEVLGAVSTGGK